MDRQARVRPQAPNLFNEIHGAKDGIGSRLPVTGTIARGIPFEDTAVNTGKKDGSDGWLELNPLEVNEKTLKRGRERYDIVVPATARLVTTMESPRSTILLLQICTR